MRTTSFSHNCSFSTERMDYQLEFVPEISKDAWIIFQKRGMSFIRSFIYLPSKIDEIRYIAKLTNAAVIGSSETKLDNTVLSSRI